MRPKADTRHGDFDGYRCAQAILRATRYRDAKTGRSERRTLAGAQFLWLILQHALPKGFRRARNFGFLHPNSKPLIALLQLLLKFAPGRPPPNERAPLDCPCCGAVMVIVKTRIPSAQWRACDPPLATGANH